MAFIQDLVYIWSSLTIGYKFTCTKKLFLQYLEVKILTLPSPKCSHETKIIQDLTHYGPTPDIQWLIHYYQKRGFGDSFSGKNSVPVNILILDRLNFNL